LGKSGIGSIEYKSGRIDNIEVAVRRAVVTGANQTAAKTQEVLADELGVDLVEVTAHGGARPAHAKWQGQVFSRKGRVTIDGVTYEDLSKATGYGRADGLCGVNCRHNFRPYVHGTSRTYTKKELKALDEKKIEYNGEEYSEYEASQIQRRIEREIRAAKRTVQALEAGGQDASAERKALREAQKTYTDFTAQTGIRKQSARTQVPNVEKVDTPIPPPKPAKKDTFAPAKTIKEAEQHISQHAKKVSYKGVENMEAVNTVSESLSGLTTRYPIKQLEVISTNGRLRRANARANYETLEINPKYLNKPPKADDWQKRIAKNPSMIEKYKAALKNVPKGDNATRTKYSRIIRQLENEMKFKRWTVGYGADSMTQIKATVTHEYGHIIADQYIGQVTRQTANPKFGWEEGNPLRAMVNKVAATHYKAKQTGDIYNMSMYADSDDYEFFAEAFTMYELGEPLPDYIKQMLKEVFAFGTV
jgi:hypothetical protein